MAQPNVRGLIVAGPLPQVSVAYRNEGYIADRVFPIINNCPPDALITRYLKGAWFRDEAGIRAPGARAVRGGFDNDYIPIHVAEYAFAKEVTDEDRRYVKYEGAPPLQPDIDAVEFATDKIDLKKERRVAGLVFGGTWSGVAGGADLGGSWVHGAEMNNSTCTFINDIETKIELIRMNTGLRPNVLMISANTMPELKEEPTILNRIKYTEKGIVTAQLLASLFGLEEVLVGDAIFSTQNEKFDGSDFAAQNVWEAAPGKGAAFLFYRAKGPGLKKASSGYQCRTPYENGLPRRITFWRENAEHQDVFEVAENTCIVQTGADLGYLWTNTIAA